MRKAILFTALMAVMLIPSTASSAASMPGGATLGVVQDTGKIGAECQTLKEDGTKATVIAAVMPRIAKSNGTYDFTSVDTPANAAISCGITPGIRIFSQPTSSTDRGLPDDLDAYRSFVGALAAHMKGRIDRFGIENEVISPTHWTDTPADYFKLLGIASAAIHANDPDAVVLDSVSSSGGFSFIMARKLAAAGNLDGALAEIQEAQDNDLGGGPRLTSTSQVEPYLNTPTLLKMQSFYDQLVANKGLIDALQLHYYGPASSLPALVQMVRSDGLTMPIEVWELGHRYLTRPFDATDQARETTRLLATAVGEGARWNVLQRYDDKPENHEYGLFDPSGNARPARYAYRTSLRELNGVTGTSALNLPVGATGYRYSDPSGWRVGIWGYGAPVPVGSKLGINATTAAVTGNEDAAPRQVKLSSVSAGLDPQWVEPDLLEVSRLPVSRKGFTKLRVSCPSGSGSAFCQGKVKILGGRHNRKLLGSRKFKVGRGVTRSTLVKRPRSRKIRGVKARIIIATPYRCPAGLKTCRSWKRLSSS